MMESRVQVPPGSQFGDVAQLVEQRTENPCVTGSIPVIPTNGGGPNGRGACFENK
jgi:hypothetical protein